MLLHGYQTLVREMATPTLPSFATACLQLIKPPASGRPLGVPPAFVDTVAGALSRLVVLYPTTLRPFAAQMRAALRSYVAPTSSDPLAVPRSLRESARRLLILLSYTAPKNGSAEEWAKAIRSTILECHATVDQVFRAVRESWESTAGYRSQPVRTGADPCGGGDSAEELPPWTGVQAGSERLVGLLEFLAEYFGNPTKGPVAVPLGELLDLTARITLVTPPTSSSNEDSIETDPAIGRDEKAELWSVLPDVHMAVLRLHCALVRRLGANAVPLATDILDQMVRVFNAGRHIPAMRETAYSLASELLLLSGPTLPKLTVDSLAPLIQASCRDILLAAGYLEDAPSPAPPSQNGVALAAATQKKAAPNADADAYLPSTASSSSSPSASHKPGPSAAAASSLLTRLLTHLPQRHLSPEQRGLLDRTAIVSADRDGMLASCLRPYRDGRGRCYASVLPFLARRFPRDLHVDVLRCNLLLRGAPLQLGAEEAAAGSAAGEQEERELAAPGWGGVRDGLQRGYGDAGKEEEDAGPEGQGKGKAPVAANAWGVEMMEVDGAAAAATAESANPFAVVAARATGEESQQRQRQAAEEPARPGSPLKRKSEQFETEASNPAKRVDTGVAAAARQRPQVAVVAAAEKADDAAGSDSESEGSVQIDMTLDDDEEEEEEEEGGGDDEEDDE